MSFVGQPMWLAHWLQPPRRTLAVFLCLMLGFGSALSWLGWRLLEQDRSLERQRVQERLEAAADYMAAELQRSLHETNAVGSNEGADRRWSDEITRRAERAIRGESVGRDADAVLDAIEKKLPRR